MRCSECSEKVLPDETAAHYAAKHPTSLRTFEDVDGSVHWPPPLTMEDEDLEEFASGKWLVKAYADQGITVTLGLGSVMSLTWKWVPRYRVPHKRNKHEYGR